MPYKTTARRRFSPLLAPLLIVIGAIAVVGLLELTNTTHFLHKQRAVSGVIPSSTPKSTTNTNKSTAPSAAPTNTSSSSTSSDTSSKSQGSDQPVTTGALIAPYGTFVSNHHPNVSGSPAPSQEQSTCQTTPGAACTIKFTNGDGVVKTLASKSADANGVVIWQWDIKDAGFTPGSWKITAVAGLNGTTKSTDDPQNLEVGP